MKALTIYQPWASWVAFGHKTIEVRTWQTQHRGKILICSSVGDFEIDENRFAPGGVALCVADLVDVRPMRKDDIEAAALHGFTKKEIANALNSFAWVLDNPREIIPVPVRGKPGLFDANIPIQSLPQDIVDYAKKHDLIAHIEYYNRQLQNQAC